MAMPPSSEARGARHAALLLHAMSPADRKWMLDALPQEERADLVPLLAELEALGIEQDPALIDAATSDDSFTAPAAISPGHGLDHVAHSLLPESDEAMLQALDDEQVSALTEILRIEPVGLIAEWLKLADWPWRKSFLQALEHVQRRKIEAHLAAMTSSAQTPPALREALISMVADRLRGRPPADVPPTPWRKLRHSLANAFQATRRRAGASR